MKSLKPPKPKVINFELIQPMDGMHEPEPYKILREIREAYHPDLRKARIALAWRKKLKHDVDGHLMLGRCVKASDLQRELVDWDFVILLNRDVWLTDEFTPQKKRALIDHELCHADAARDKYGFPKHDERDRYVWRVRKHDIEEFRDIVKRHGCYKADLEEFAKALLTKREAPLFAAAVDGTNPQQTETTERVIIQIGKKSETAAAKEETSIEERVRTRAAKSRKKLMGQDAILPDPHQTPSDHPEA